MGKAIWFCPFSVIKAVYSLVLNRRCVVLEEMLYFFQKPQCNTRTAELITQRPEWICRCDIDVNDIIMLWRTQVKLQPWLKTRQANLILRNMIAIQELQGKSKLSWEPVHVPRRRQKRSREQKFLFVLDNACDERTMPLILHMIIGLFVTSLLQNIQELQPRIFFKK